MTISFRKKRLRLWLSVPASLVVYGLSKAAEKGDGKNGVSFKISKQTKREIKRSLKQAKKNFGRLVLVDVKGDDGTKVKIRL